MPILIAKILIQLWRRKFEALCLLLSVVVLGLVLYVSHLNEEREKLIQQHEAYVLEQAIQSKTATAAWNERLKVVEEQFSEKVKALERANVTLSANAERLSVALSESKRKYATASEEARAEYTDTLNTISGQCIAEYRRMASIAQQHANDAERLSNTWPVNREPP